jgi:hypothetical protein
MLPDPGPLGRGKRSWRPGPTEKTTSSINPHGGGVAPVPRRRFPRFPRNVGNCRSGGECREPKIGSEGGITMCLEDFFPLHVLVPRVWSRPPFR